MLNKWLHLQRREPIILVYSHNCGELSIAYNYFNDQVFDSIYMHILTIGELTDIHFFIFIVQL